MNLKVAYALLKEACSAWAEDHASTLTNTVRGPKEVLCIDSRSSADLRVSTAGKRQTCRPKGRLY